MFKRAVQRYGQTPLPETPYQRAGQVWDDRIGSARAQAKNWRLMAFGCFGLVSVLAGTIIWQSTQSRVTPYVVEVDHLGESQAVSPAIQNYKPSDGEVAWYLARFISNVRSVSIDPVVVRKSWLEAYDYATDHGAMFLNQYARDHDPFKDLGSHTVTVQINSIVRVSDTSFQMKWTEQIYERDALSKTERWTAILSVVTKTPATAEILRKNPLGIYVNGIDWSRELDTP